MTSVADEGHLDPLAETSQGRSRQELRCLCKQIFLCVFTSSCFCLCVCVLCSLEFIHQCITTLGSAWHGCVLAGDYEKLGVISYGCQTLGRAPYHLPLTHCSRPIVRHNLTG